MENREKRNHGFFFNSVVCFLLRFGLFASVEFRNSYIFRDLNVLRNICTLFLIFVCCLVDYVSSSSVSQAPIVARVSGFFFVNIFHPLNIQSFNPTSDIWNICCNFFLQIPLVRIYLTGISHNSKKSTHTHNIQIFIVEDNK